jgi:hypothetical protein
MRASDLIHLLGWNMCTCRVLPLSPVNVDLLDLRYVYESPPLPLPTYR